jgi:hypothetical protein
LNESFSCVIIFAIHLQGEGIVSEKNRITIICGHYGTGKTNLCLNLAMESVESGNKTILVDVDIVNPYFRSSEYIEMLSTKGIEVITPNFANTTLDTPSLPARLYTIFEDDNADVFIDAGGDDAGATALGTISQMIKDNGYKMLYVVNEKRMLISDPADAVINMKEIEEASRLTATGIINNTHLGVDTTYKNCIESKDYAEKVSELAKLPLLFSTIPDFAVEGNKVPKDFKVIKRYVLFPWENQKTEV